MNPLFKKLQYKESQRALILNAPDTFTSTLNELDDVEYTYDLSDTERIEYAILFVSNKAELQEYFLPLDRQIKDDVIVWICYPKKSSKKYSSDITRDQGWEVVGAAGYEGVRQVAIDEDWSALRFRKVEYIKDFTRNVKMVLSKEGKKRKSKDKE